MFTIKIICLQTQIYNYAKHNMVTKKFQKYFLTLINI